MGLYFYAMVPTDSPSGDDLEFLCTDEGFEKLYDGIPDKYSSFKSETVIYMKDISEHGVFIRPRDVDIVTGYFSGDAGCFIKPIDLVEFIENEYELRMLNKYIELDALMFPL